MAIERRGWGVVSSMILICDECDYECEEDFETLDSIIKYIRFTGWTSENAPGGWRNLCPRCVYNKNREEK